MRSKRFYRSAPEGLPRLITQAAFRPDKPVKIGFNSWDDVAVKNQDAVRQAWSDAAEFHKQRGMYGPVNF